MKYKINYQKIYKLGGGGSGGGGDENFSKEKLNKTLIFIANLLINNSIDDWFIAYGTLLGIIRDNSCVDQDDDVDIMIKETYYDKVKSLLIDNGIEIEYGYGIGNSRNILKTITNEEYATIDFYMCNIDDKGNFHDNWENLTYSNCYDNNKKLIKYNWNNIELQIPNNSKTKLEKIYGPEWYIKQKKK